ncbi:MAG TPA: glycosyltransferase [Candidatus Woesebacteria bacterium]|nr:glycosyltransferase [Candidatus Woesebacteria bacterium]
MLQTPFFSIVIPTLNEEKYLPLLLKDLQQQSFHNFEVIHVDAHSTDATMKKAKLFDKKLLIKHYQNPKRNVSQQRNLGASKSNGRWIIFMDADDRLPSNYLEDVTQQLKKHPEVDIFTTWFNTKQKNPTDSIILSIINLGIDLYQSVGQPSAFGALIGCKRKVTNKIQFDDQQKVLEDSLFVYTAWKNGYNFHVFHKPTFNFSLRRFRKDGILKITLQGIMMQQMYFRKKNFHSKDFGYLMSGGDRYTDQDKYTSLNRLKKLLESLP